MRDQMNHVHPVRAISPAAAVTDNTAIVSQIIDTKGYNALTFLILFGAIADADMTMTFLVEDGDDSGLSDAAAVSDDQLVGTEVLAAGRYDSDNLTRKIGYVGDKRYVRLTITPANNTGNLFVSAIALLGHPALLPTSNPPA